MAKDKKEEVNFKEMYGEAALLKADEMIKQKNINLEKRIIYKAGK